jgi:Putative auto-transporter adhesin, head GIN domain
MNKIGLMLLSTVAFLLASCEKYSIKGSGDTISETRVTTPFRSVETHYNIKAVITYGVTQELRVTGYENLLAVLETEVSGGVLKLKFPDRYQAVKNGNVVAQITLPAVEKATIHGSGDIEIYNFRDVYSIHAIVHGSGNIRISNSEYQFAGLHIYGSGNISSQTLEAKEVEANIYGSGNISVTVEEKLKATINGSGNVNYWGQPAVETVIQGSGRVIKK